MAKHSPEPWHVGGVGGCRPKLVYDASGRTILRSWGSRSDEEDDANVELAAQAPKLREQVRILREALERVSKECPDTPKLEDDEASRAEVAALRHQLEERKSPDMVTVPREEWEVLNTISAFWCPPFGVPQNTATEALFAKLDALRSGEAENKGGA